MLMVVELGKKVVVEVVVVVVVESFGFAVVTTGLLDEMVWRMVRVVVVQIVVVEIGRSRQEQPRGRRGALEVARAPMYSYGFGWLLGTLLEDVLLLDTLLLDTVLLDTLLLDRALLDRALLESLLLEDWTVLPWTLVLGPAALLVVKAVREQ